MSVLKPEDVVEVDGEKIIGGGLDWLGPPKRASQFSLCGEDPLKAVLVAKDDGTFEVDGQVTTDVERIGDAFKRWAKIYFETYVRG